MQGNLLCDGVVSFQNKGFLSNLRVEAIVIAGVESDAAVCKLWMYVLP